MSVSPTGSGTQAGFLKNVEASTVIPEARNRKLIPVTAIAERRSRFETRRSTTPAIDATLA